jgi:hypothetical protein
MGGALGMAPSRVPIVVPSTCCAFAVQACKASKNPSLHTIMFLVSKLPTPVECFLQDSPIGDKFQKA